MRANKTVTQGWSRIVPEVRPGAQQAARPASRLFHLCADLRGPCRGAARVGRADRSLRQGRQFHLERAGKHRQLPGHRCLPSSIRGRGRGQQAVMDHDLHRHQEVCNAERLAQCGPGAAAVGCRLQAGNRQGHHHRRRGAEAVSGADEASRRCAGAHLFDALETEALKVTAPAGYSVCNDTEKPVYAAIGMKTGKVWPVRGWWNVAPGACARALTDPIARQKVYLLVERRGKDAKAVVTGAAKFCVTDIAFQIEGRERCGARGLREAGFAETNVKGLSGYAAHVGEEGLLPAAPVVK